MSNSENKRNVEKSAVNGRESGAREDQGKWKLFLFISFTDQLIQITKFKFNHDFNKKMV